MSDKTLTDYATVIRSKNSGPFSQQNRANRPLANPQ